MLLDMLTSSWGQSKVLELILQDYMTITRPRKQQQQRPDQDHLLVDQDVVPSADTPSSMTPPSRAPLRNINKDMICALSDLQEVISSRTTTTRRCQQQEDQQDIDEVLKKEFPVFVKSAQQVNVACCGGDQDLSHGPFLSLVELLRPHNNNKNNNNKRN